MLAALGPAAPVPDDQPGLAGLLDQPQEALVLGAAALAAALLVRLALGLLLAFAAALPGQAGRLAERVSRTLTPRLARHVLDVVIGVGVTGGSTALLSGPALAAAASPVPTPVLASPHAVTQVWPDLARPGADLTAPAAAPSDAAGADAESTEQGVAPAAPGRSLPAAVTVHPGDCLWNLAAERLGAAGASPNDQQIATATEAWWQVNRDVIGPDPGLLLPGQQLQPPA